MDQFGMYPDVCVLNMFPQDYSKEGMTTSQEELMQHLRQFGLVYQRKVSWRV